MIVEAADKSLVGFVAVNVGASEVGVGLSESDVDDVVAVSEVDGLSVDVVKESPPLSSSFSLDTILSLDLSSSLGLVLS